jgi:hypothetical protein
MTVGIQPPPGTGPQLIDGVWVNGIAQGVNFSSISGVVAAGSAQSGATQLAGQNMLVEIDTSTASTGLGVALPFAYAGSCLMFYNNTANNCTIYPSIANNPITAAQDTIDNTTSLSLNAHTSRIVWCAKTGVWAGQ